MRRKEILTLTRPQVDLARCIIRLPETKSGKPQEVVLNQAARNVLIELQAGAVAPKGYLFHGKPKEDESERCIGDIKKAWHGALKDAGLSDFHFHDLRHVTATRLVETGAHPRVIQSILRQSSLKMTERYTDPQDASKRDALDRMPNYSESGAECQKSVKKGGTR
jgi:integrase